MGGVAVSGDSVCEARGPDEEGCWVGDFQTPPACAYHVGHQGPHSWEGKVTKQFRTGDWAAVAAAARELCEKATQYGETTDGDTAAYIVPKGAMHRLIGLLHNVGEPPSLRLPK